MSIDYQTVAANLMRNLPFVDSILILAEDGCVVYTREHWGIEPDLDIIMDRWEARQPGTIMISSRKYVIRICTSVRLIASSAMGEGHIIGAKDGKRAIIVHIEPDGIVGLAYIEMERVLSFLRAGKPYRAKDLEDDATSSLVDSQQEQGVREEGTVVPFTARLMAYYRAQENTRENPLIVDPFAERLAGDLSAYLADHIRHSQMEYPLVRSYYIETKLLEPWCKNHKESQVVLLGAGLDTRVYRFEPFQINTHTVFDVDLPIINEYKEEILRNEHPLCNLVRISADLSTPAWASSLVQHGFLEGMPTFWILEGLVYYLDQDKVGGLLTKVAEMSAPNSAIFVDIMYASRWVSFPYSIYGESFTRYLKWGLDMKTAPAFFSSAGWNVTCSFADAHDQGRDVGRRAMIFVHGVRSRRL
jgi:methyltransferase (TIGR00027 family)